MPHYLIRLINSEFESCEEGDYASVEAALSSAIAAATEIAREAVLRGEIRSAGEIRVEVGDHVSGRRLVSLGVADLAPGG